MKFLKSVAIIIIFSISISLVSCTTPGSRGRNPANFPNTTWIATNGEVKIILRVQEEETVFMTYEFYEEYRDLTTNILGEIIVGDASYECYVESCIVGRSLSMISTDVPKQAETYYDAQAILSEYCLIGFSVVRYKSVTHLVAKVASSEIIEEGKVFHFYRQDSE